jgi:hypothetical protein
MFFLGVKVLCVCREGADRAIDDVWVGCVFLLSHWGPCVGCLLSRTPQPVHRPPPSVLLQNNLYYFGPCCSWCGRPQAPGGAGVEQGSHLPNVSPNSQRPWRCQWVPTCAAELPLAMALAGHAPRPRAACFVVVGSWFSPRGPGLLRAMTGACPNLRRIPSLKNNIFFRNHLWHVRPTPLECRPGGRTWTLLQLVGAC